MLHTLEDFCKYLFPNAGPDELRRQYFQMARLAEEKYRRMCYQKIPAVKSDGSVREILAPTPPLKFIQRGILGILGNSGAISRNATAYVKGRSLLDNAFPHVGKALVVKLDIRDFFGSIGFVSVFSAIDRCLRRSKLVGVHELNGYDRLERDERHYNQVLSQYFSKFCTLEGKLVQGAPASPYLSNLVFAPLDGLIEKYCCEREISYTRYSDDITFSGDFSPMPLIHYVSRLLKANGFILNEEKTVIHSQGACQKVTGIVVNTSANVPRAYRRNIRQEMYYLKRFGMAEHLERAQLFIDPLSYLRKLDGQIAYVLQIRPQDREFLQYASHCKALIQTVQGEADGYGPV